MSWIEDSLNNLEARLRAMVEGNSSNDGFPRKLHHQLDQTLANAMQAELRSQSHNPGSGGMVFSAPDQYTLVMPAEQAHLLLAHPNELDRLSRKLASSAVRANILLAAPPLVRVVADPMAKELSVLVDFSHTEMEDSFTAELEGVAGSPSFSLCGHTPKAFLIVNGLTTFPLTQPVINIGSDPSNQLVLNQPDISAVHAQLRLNTDHFIIFDLDSRIGTLVNGVAVSNHVLNPGDVIMLAGLPLVYGQETSSCGSYTQKLPARPGSLEVL